MQMYAPNFADLAGVVLDVDHADGMRLSLCIQLHPIHAQGVATGVVCMCDQDVIRSSSVPSASPGDRFAEAHGSDAQETGLARSRTASTSLILLGRYMKLGAATAR